MNYEVTVNDLVQAYWEKEACNLTIVCTVPEEHPLWFLILMSLGIAVPRDCKGQDIFFPFFWVSCMTGCFWLYFYACSGKLGERQTSCWLMHIFRRDLSLWNKETWKNSITIFINPADGIAQASMFEFCMKRKKNLNKNYPNKKKAPHSWCPLLSSIFCLGFIYA